MHHNAKPKVVVVGCFQSGKSTLVNCLLGDYVAPTGIGLPTTHLATTYAYGEIENVKLERADAASQHITLDKFLERHEQGELQEFARAGVTLWKPLLNHLQLVDTPGLDANSSDTTNALEAIEDAGFVLMLVTNKGPSEMEEKVLRRIGEAGKSYALVINCNEQQCWDPGNDQNRRIMAEIKSAFSKQGQPLSASCCNLAWYWHASGGLDREIRFHRGRGEPVSKLLQKSEGLREDVERRLKKQAAQSLLELVNQSRFLEVRRELVECGWKSLAETGPAMQRMFERCADAWRTQMKRAVESAKECLAK